MNWLRAQPVNWHVLADPGHAWKYGSSVRVAARRDTLLESGKDSSMAMYDRDLARAGPCANGGACGVRHDDDR